MYMVWPGILDMSAVTNIFSSPEQSLLCAAFAQIAKHYKIPSNIIVGAPDSKIPDQQAGYEKMMGMLLVALAGADEIALVGGLIDSAKVANYEQVIIDEEITGYVQRNLKGIEVSEEKLAVDVINEIGAEGNYISHSHTLRYFKEEQYFSNLSDRSSRQTWVAKGKKDIRAKSIEKARQILEEHRPNPLPDKIVNELEKEVATIYKREGIKYSPYISDSIL